MSPRHAYARRIASLASALLSCAAGTGAGASALALPVAPAGQPVHPVVPAGGSGGILAVDGRAPARLRQRQRRNGVDLQVDAELVQRGDLLGGDEAPAAGAAKDDPVEYVLRRGGDDVIDASNGLAVACKHRDAALEHGVGDRRTLAGSLWHGAGHVTAR